MPPRNFHTVESVLLRRLQCLFPKKSKPQTEKSRIEVERLIKAYETELLELGYACSPRLLREMANWSVADLIHVQKNSLKVLAELTGAAKRWKPLFTKFPDGVPDDTTALYWRRVAAYLYQQPDQPCVLCSRTNTLHFLKPCGHFVCDQCFNPEEYNGCPICNKAIEPGSIYLNSREQVARLKPPQKLHFKQSELKIIDLGESLKAASQNVLRQLLSRKTPLSPVDNADLKSILKYLKGQAFEALPANIPVRESRAVVLSDCYYSNVNDSANLTLWGKAFDRLVTTATDVLRFAAAYSHSDASLIQAKIAFKSMPRQLRRICMAKLESLNFEYLCEDMLRHKSLWRRLSRKLHVFEASRHFPKLSLATAVLRKTDVSAKTKLSQLLQTEAAKYPGLIKIDDARIKFLSWACRIEQQLSLGSVSECLNLLKQRPGELSRRLDHVLRICQHETDRDAVCELFQSKSSKMASPVLLTLASHLASRDQKISKRVFFPRGDTLHSWASPDRRVQLTSEVTKPFIDCAQQELLKRFGQLPKFEQGLIDLELTRVVVPFNERTKSVAMAALPRGSRIAIPDKPILRIFVHWMQDGHYDVDLDLSAVCYGDDWSFKGGCDFTGLKFGKGAAIHSGDFTSAPEPDGACEFIDLAVDKFQSHGVRYVVMNIYSYNNVPFDRLKEGFAGFMAHDGQDTEAFVARDVEQRFDLRGRAKVAIPLFVDLARREMFWLDVLMTVDGDYHQIARHSAGVGHMCSDFANYFTSGARPNMFELSLLHAASRCRQVLVREDGEVAASYQRQDNESAWEFYLRIKGNRELGEFDFNSSQAALSLVTANSPDLAPGSECYCVDPRGLSFGEITRLSGVDLLS